MTAWKNPLERLRATLSPVDPAELTGALLERALAAGIDACGVCRAEPYLRAERAIERALGAGAIRRHGLHHAPARHLMPPRVGAARRSLGGRGRAELRPAGAREAAATRRAAGMPRYARRDEYALLRDRLRTLGSWLREAVPGSRFVVHVDSNGHVDREAAARAGIAVYGKNTLAITRRHGSWVVLGVLITDAELAPPTPRPSSRPGMPAASAGPASTPARPTRSWTTECWTRAAASRYLSQSRLEQLPFARGVRGPRLRLRHLPGRVPLEPRRRAARGHARAGSGRRRLPAACTSGWRTARAPGGALPAAVHPGSRRTPPAAKRAGGAGNGRGQPRVGGRAEQPLQLVRPPRARSRARAAGRAPRPGRGSSGSPAPASVSEP